MQKSNRFKDYIRNTFMIYAICLVLLIFVLFICSVMAIYKKTVVRTNQTYNEELSELMESELIKYKNDLLLLQHSLPIQQVLANRGDQLKVNELLYKYVNKRKMKASFALIDSDAQIIASNLYTGNQAELQQSRFLKNLLEKLERQPEQIVTSMNRAVFQEPQISQYVIGKAVVANEGIKGYLLFFLNDIGSYVKYKDIDMLVVADHFDNIIFSSSMLLANSMGKLDFRQTDTHTAIINGDYYYLTQTEIQQGPLQILTYTSMSAYRQSLATGFIVLMCIGIIVVLLIFAATPLLIKRHLQSFDLLVEAVNQCKDGQLEYRIQSRTFDEFQSIHDDFNHMMSKIQALIEHNDQIAEKKRKIEIKHLENQFHPHFVFNVLEMLRYEILFNPKNASDIVVMFANLMRYNINYGQAEIELQTDLNYLQDYMRLQKMRFNDRLLYTISVEPQLLSCQIPKLLMQSIAENSIKHSMEHTAQLSVQIQIEQKGTEMQMIITDNGPGMTEQRLSYVQQLLSDKEAMPENIGLYNSHRIVQLLYGENYGLSIASSLNTGTQTVITIPVIREAGEVQDV